MQLNNATWLFVKPHDNFHPSESFWTSLFVLYLLSKKRKTIPTYCFLSDGRTWEFREVGHFRLSEPIEFFDVIVEGKVSSETFDAEPPMEVTSLAPDIIIKAGKKAYIIEAKTTGRHAIGEYQLRTYRKLCSWLVSIGWKPELLFLISAGHEKNSDWELLRFRNAPEQSGKEERLPHKILLWEKVLEVVSESGGDLAAILDRVDFRKHRMLDQVGPVELAGKC